MGLTSQELSVLRKSLLFAANENAEGLDEKEIPIAENMARIVGGVYAAKRAEREERRQGDDGEHQHSVPRTPRQTASAR